MKYARGLLCLGLLSCLAAISACKGPPPLPGTPGMPGMPGMPGLPSSLPGLPSIPSTPSTPGLPSPTGRPSLPSPGTPSVIPSPGSGPPGDGGTSPGGDQRPKGDQSEGDQPKGDQSKGDHRRAIGGRSRTVWRRWLGVEQRDPGIVRESPGRRFGTARIRGFGWRQRTREGAGGLRRPDPERTAGDSGAQKRNRGPAAAARGAQWRIGRQGRRRRRV